MTEVLPSVLKETYKRGISGNIMVNKVVSVQAKTAKLWEQKDE